MRKIFSLILIVLLNISLIPNEAFGAGARPILKVDCGSLLTLMDKDGEFIFFNPRVEVSYWGKKLNYWVYYSYEPGVPLSEQGQKYGNETRQKASPSTFGTSNFDWSNQLRYGFLDSGYTEVYMVVKDSLKRSSTMKCTWQKKR